MIEPNLHQIITTDQAFIDLAADRLYPVLLPDESPLPAATYQVIAVTPLYAADGRVNYTQTRIEIDTWADTYGAAKLLAAAINDVIDGFSGPFADGSAIEFISVITSQDLFESAPRIYRVRTDYLIQHTS